jgi:hypothetical protein
MAISPEGTEVTAGRIADLTEVQNQNGYAMAARKYSHIRVQLPSGKEINLLFTDYEIKRARERAEKNPEDLPPVSWIRNLID